MANKKDFITRYAQILSPPAASQEAKVLGIFRHQSLPIADAPWVLSTTAASPSGLDMSHTYTLPLEDAAEAYSAEGLRLDREKLVAVRKLGWLKLATA